MHSKSFENPQRQSEIGVVLIFFATLYKLLRGFWAVGAYLVLSSPSAKTWIYIGLGSVVLGGLVLVYSYVYYRKFLFHIDHEKEAFILQKGVFSSKEIEISFDKIQQVNTEQSLLQRLGNVYKLVIDTAGGKEKEVSIQAISKAKAERLSSILMEAKESLQSEMEVESDSASPKNEEIGWRYKMDMPTLLKIGISSNYFRGLGLILVFFSTIYQEMNRWFEEYSGKLDSYMNELPDPSESIFGVLLVIFVLLMGSILITIIEVFIKYFNLTLQRTKHSLQLEMGLKTNTKVSLQPRRVQMLQIKTNPVQKMFDLYELKISLANSEDVLQKNKIKIPGLGKGIVSKVNAFLYQEETDNFHRRFKPHKILLVRRMLFSLMPVFISGAALIWIPYLDFLWWMLLAGMYSSLTGGYQIFLFNSLELNFSEEFLRKKHGVWNQTETRLEIYKMQAVTISEPYFYKRRFLVNLNFHTAGGDVSFRAVDKSIVPFLNYIFYKIETEEKNWM